MHSKRLAATVAAGVLVMSGLATGTANAATAPTVTATPECGKVTITVVNPTEAANLRLQVKVDRGPVRTIPVAADGPTVHPVVFQEDSGRHLVRWRLWGGPERDWDNPTWHVGQFTDFDPRGFRGKWAEVIPVKSDCHPNVDVKRADAPTVVQPECDAAKGKLVIPSDRGVTYKVRTATRDYRTVRAGEYKVRPGVYRVKAEARPGVKLVGVDRWRLEVEAAEACPTPTPTATDEPTPTPTVTPTDPPAEEPSEEPEPQPTITETTTEQRTIVIRDYLPVRVDTGLGGTARNAR